MEQYIKAFIIKEFTHHQITPGYHTLNCINNQGIIVTTLKCDNEVYSYIKRVHQDDIKTRLKLYLLIDNIIVKISSAILTIEVFIHDFDIYKLKIREEFPLVFAIIRIFGPQDPLGPSVPSVPSVTQRLYQQLKMHKVSTMDSDRYTKIVSQDENYYNDLYLDYWNTGTEDIDLSNDAIVKAFPQFLSYFNIYHLVNTTELLDFAAENFDFTEGSSNYNLLEKLITEHQVSTIDKVLKYLKIFVDKGILTVLVGSTPTTEKKWQSLFKILLNWDLVQPRDYIDELFEKIIERNYIYALTLLLKKGYTVKDKYILSAKELKRDKIHCVLCGALQ